MLKRIASTCFPCQPARGLELQSTYWWRGSFRPSGHVAGAAFWGCRRGLADVEDLDAAVGPLPDLDGHVLRAEGAAHYDPAVLLVDQVALQLCKKKWFREVSQTEVSGIITDGQLECLPCIWRSALLILW